jgi:hypothetical protein
MLCSRWQKVIRDRWLHTIRTLLVVLSIAVGVLVVGSMIAGRDSLLDELHRSHLSCLPQPMRSSFLCVVSD